MWNGLVLIGKVILLVNGYLESFGVEKGCFMQFFFYVLMIFDFDVDVLLKFGG